MTSLWHNKLHCPTHSPTSQEYSTCNHQMLQGRLFYKSNTGEGTMSPLNLTETIIWIKTSALGCLNYFFPGQLITETIAYLKWFLKKIYCSPGWQLSGLNMSLQTKWSPVRFPVRAHAWVGGRVPSGAHTRSNHTLMFLSPSFSFPSLLSKNE